MKRATIRAISAGVAPGYAWKWVSSSDQQQSSTVFSYYYDCVTDAREHGYEVELTRAHGEMAPGGAGYGRLNGA